MKRTIQTFALAFLTSAQICFAAAAEAPIVHVQFDSDAVGPYTSEMLKRDWGKITWANLYDRAHIVFDEEAGRGNVLRIDYPKGAVGPGQGGGQFVVPLPPSEELWLSYCLKFGKGFDFRLGGKLPGLTSGGGKYTGGRIPKEGDGWSARYMWKRGGKAIVYLYYVDMPGKWGENLRLEGAAFTPGTWHQITQHIKVNTPGEANGVLEVWFDGKKVLSCANLRFRIGEKGPIDSFYFSTFHGGGSREWAPRVDSFCFFDDFLVSREPPGYLLDRSANKPATDAPE